MLFLGEKEVEEQNQVLIIVKNLIKKMLIINIKEIDLTQITMIKRNVIIIIITIIIIIIIKIIIVIVVIIAIIKK